MRGFVLWAMLFSCAQILVKSEDAMNPCSSPTDMEDVIACATSRGFDVLTKGSNEETFEILPGVSIESDPGSSRSPKSLNDQIVPNNPRDKTEKIINLVAEASARLISGKTLKMKLPEVSSTGIARMIAEGRGKMKKMMSPMLLGLGAKALLVVPLFFIGLKLLAAKALLLSKLAFAMALVLFAQTFLGGGGGFGGLKTPLHGFGHGTNYGAPYPGWTTNQLGSTSYGAPSSQYPYARSINGSEEENEENSEDFIQPKP